MPSNRCQLVRGRLWIVFYASLCVLGCGRVPTVAVAPLQVVSCYELEEVDDNPDKPWPGIDRTKCTEPGDDVLTIERAREYWAERRSGSVEEEVQQPVMRTTTMRGAPVGFNDVTFTWDKVVDPTLAGYIILWGDASSVYTERVSVGKIETITLALPCGTASVPRRSYVVARSVDVVGVESGNSNQVTVSPVCGTVTPPVKLVPPRIGGVVVVIVQP